jgi:hypothetical protein
MLWYREKEADLRLSNVSCTRIEFHKTIEMRKNNTLYVWQEQKLSSPNQQRVKDDLTTNKYMRQKKALFCVQVSFSCVAQIM